MCLQFSYNPLNTYCKGGETEIQYSAFTEELQELLIFIDTFGKFSLSFTFIVKGPCLQQLLLNLVF